jgi:hypothetical protein
MKRMAWLVFANFLLLLAPGGTPVPAAGAQGILAKLGQTVPPPPPSAPLNFTGSAISDTSVHWSWDPVTGASNYVLHDDSENVIATVPPDCPSTVETGLPAGIQVVRHVHASVGGVLSASSNRYEADTVGIEPQQKPVTRDDKKDTVTFPGDDLSKLTEDEIKNLLLKAAKAVGVPLTDDAAAAKAKAIKAAGERAETSSRVRVTNTQGKPNKRTDKVQIVTVIGDGAPDTSKDHENGHRIINETLANDAFLSTMSDTVINDTGLTDPDIDSIVNDKLGDLEFEIMAKYDALMKKVPAKDLPKTDQKGNAETLAALKRDVAGRLAKKFLDDAVAKKGGKLTKDEARTQMREVDAVLAKLDDMISNVKKLDDASKDFKSDPDKFIEKLLK